MFIVLLNSSSDKELVNIDQISCAFQDTQYAHITRVKLKDGSYYRREQCFEKFQLLMEEYKVLIK